MKKDGKNSILIVDDEAMCIDFLLSLLGDDYTVYVAKNGNSAITAAMNNTPDLIVMDINMPDISGYDVISALRFMRETVRIPVVFFSGSDEPRAMEKGLTFGAVDYIHKNLGADAIMHKISEQIDLINAKG